MSKLMSGILKCLNFIDRYCAVAVCRIGCYFPKRKITMILVILMLMFAGFAYSETGEDANALLIEGIKLYKNNDYNDAIEKFNAAVTIYEKSGKGTAYQLW